MNQIFSEERKREIETEIERDRDREERKDKYVKICKPNMFQICFKYVNLNALPVAVSFEAFVSSLKNLVISLSICSSFPIGDPTVCARS